MIKIEVFYNLKDEIYKIIAQGHAKFNEDGKDIVCASISVALQQAIIGLLYELKIKDDFYEMEKGNLLIDRTKIKDIKFNKEINLILNTMFLTIKTIQEEYPCYIKIVKSRI